ncbi:MAG: DUF892 family protein [Hymenobacter sp.]
MKTGGKIAAKVTEDIEDDATNDQLKAALKQGTETSKQWTARIDRAIEEAGGADEQDNPVQEAHYEVSKRIRSKAKSDYARDLGIIAAGQLALHYWIASFGIMHAYAKRAGLSQTAQDMETCVNEAKQADEQHTNLAIQIMQNS